MVKHGKVNQWSYHVSIHQLAPARIDATPFKQTLLLAPERDQC